MRQTWAEWLRSFDGFRPEAREFIDLGEDVLVLVEFGGRGKASGVPVEAMPGGCLFSIRNGRVVKFRTFASRGEAIQAAGQQE